MQFRTAEPGDIAALAALLLRASPGRTLEAENEYVTRCFQRPGSVIQIAVLDAKPVGVVSFEPSRVSGDHRANDGNTAYLRLIVTDPKLWGTGLAPRLLQWAESQMAEAGFTDAYLWCGASNARAQRFYERAGWAADGRRREHEDWGQMRAYAKHVSEPHA